MAPAAPDPSENPPAAAGVDVAPNDGAAGFAAVLVAAPNPNPLPVLAAGVAAAPLPAPKPNPPPVLAAVPAGLPSASRTSQSSSHTANMHGRTSVNTPAPKPNPAAAPVAAGAAAAAPSEKPPAAGAAALCEPKAGAAPVLAPPNENPPPVPPPPKLKAIPLLSLPCESCTCLAGNNSLFFVRQEANKGWKKEGRRRESGARG